MRLSIFVSAIFIFFLSEVCGFAIEVFRFIDEAGTVHLTDAPSDSRYQRLAKYGTTEKRLRRSEFDALIEKEANKYGMDQALIKAIVRVESNFNDRAISPAGAIGLMQLMPQTASTLGVTDPFSPEENVQGGIRYLRSLLNILNDDLKLALAAYNAGLQRVLRHGAIPPIRETERYVEKVLYFYRLYAT